MAAHSLRTLSTGPGEQLSALLVSINHNLIGLARVSTGAQDAQLQQDALALAGCGRVYLEKVSTRKAASERPASPQRSTTCAPVTRSSSGIWTGSAVPSGGANDRR